MAGILVLAAAPAAQRRDDYGRGRLFSLPRSQDDIFEWRRAQSDITEGRMVDAVEKLQRLLVGSESPAHHQDGVIPLDHTSERYSGMRLAVLQTLRDLPEVGRLAYEKLAQRQAGRLARTAFDGVRPTELAVLANDFPTSELGRRARMRLADLALEQGHAVEAEFHYRALLDALPTVSELRPTVEQRLRAARVLSHNAVRPATESPAREADAAMDEVMPGGAQIGETRGWPAYGGGGSGARVMRPPLGTPELRWAEGVRAEGFQEQPFAMHAVGDLSSVVINDGHAMACFDPLRKTVLWEEPGPIASDPEAHKYESAINRDMVLAAACTDEIVVGALQVPNEGRNTRFRHIDVIRVIPRRRLFARDRSTGKLLWSHWDRPDGPLTRRFAGHDVAGPPLIYGDTVYVACHDETGAIAYYLSAYELSTGRPRWRQLICSSQGEVNMFGNSRREYAASPLAIHDGVIYGATNLGVVFAADAETGRVRWISAYDVIQMPETRLTDQQDRQVFFANNPVVVANGVVACAPLDSAYVLAFDAEHGKPLWRLYYQASLQRHNDLRWLLGAMADEFILSGRGVVAVRADPDDQGNPVVRQIRTPERLGLPADLYYPTEAVPRGALTDDTIYFVSPEGLCAFRAHGDARDTGLPATDAGLGNLLLVDGLMVSLRDGNLQFYYDTDKLLQEAEREVQRHADDPLAMLRLAALVRATGADAATGMRAERAEKLYRRGLELARERGMGVNSPVYRRLAAELFELTRDRAQKLHVPSPARALALVRQARDGALQSSQWLEAQRYVLEWVHDQRDTYLAELDLMGRTHGSEQHFFAGVGRLPVAAYVLWETARNTDDPTDAIRCYQELMERFPNVVLSGETARAAASDAQRRLIEKHGRSVYAAVEKRAEQALTEAGNDRELLRALAIRFPHSEATQRALRRLLDLAVQQGDLAAAVHGYQQALDQGVSGPGLDRRMMEAARRSGNLGLARGLAERLLSEHPEAISDYPPDADKPIGQVVHPVEEPPPPAAQRLQLPTHQVAKLQPSGPGIGLRLIEVRRSEGFTPQPPPPLYVSLHGAQLQAYDPGRGSAMFEHALFSVPHTYLEGEPLLLCGETLVAPESERVRGLHYATGEQRWAYSAGDGRMLVNLGCQRGVLHLFSEPVRRRKSDGGILIGIEPLTGAVLFERVFPLDSECVPPISSAGSLWVFDPGRSAPPEIRRIDPLSGRDVQTIPLQPALLRRLGLEEPERRAWRVHQLHMDIFADEDSIYIPVDSDDSEPPRVAALDFDGHERWMWRGFTGRVLAMCARYRDRIVVLERGSRGSSRLAVLDRRSGANRREVVLGPYVTVRNWSRTQRSEPAPSVLLLVDQANNVHNLTAYDLDGGSSFSYQLDNTYESIPPSPILTDDFLALPARKRSNSNLTLFVLDRKSRRSLLEGGANNLPLPFLPQFKIQPLPPYTAIQSSGQISVFGESGRPPK